jgi:hypothetical protein
VAAALPQFVFCGRHLVLGRRQASSAALASALAKNSSPASNEAEKINTVDWAASPPRGITGRVPATLPPLNREVGCRCPIGACRRAGTPSAKAPLAPSVNTAKLRAANRSPAANLCRFAAFGVAIQLKDRMVLCFFPGGSVTELSATDA